MPTKAMVAACQFGYRPVLTNEHNQVIQHIPGIVHTRVISAQRDAQAWASRNAIWFDDSIILPRDTVTHAQLQVGQQRSVRAYLGA